MLFFYGRLRFKHMRCFMCKYTLLTKDKFFAWIIKNEIPLVCKRIKLIN